MHTLEQNEWPEMLMQLDQAIYHHAKWYDAITRTLVCHLPHDERDVADDAHRQCRLGQWYYETAPEKLRRHPSFIAIEVEHQHLHQQAAKLLRQAEAGDPISPLDYDCFVNGLERLRLLLQTLKRELEEAIFNRDPLTGVNSRAGMLTKLREQLELAKRHVQSCCIVMMDLDHFKHVNDDYGHSAGDQVLAASARFVMTHLRPYDKLFRYGGEEFVVCMQNLDVDAGYAIVERVREGLAATPIDCGGGVKLQVTASFGITLLDPDASVEASIDRADKAMYAAKSAGRNCTRIWDPSM